MRVHPSLAPDGASIAGLSGQLANGAALVAEGIGEHVHRLAEYLGKRRARGDELAECVFIRDSRERAMRHAVRAELHTLLLQRANPILGEERQTDLAFVPDVRATDLARDKKDRRAHATRF